MAAVASYVLGDSVTQFSIIIGVYLSALGIGAYLSRFVERHLARTFIDVELCAALLGGFSAPSLFLAYSFTHAFQLILYAICLGVGILVGLELPLLIRILQRQLEFKDLIAKALTFDYAGALLGSLAFSLLLVPELGLVHTSLACGLLNALVGLGSTFLLADDAEGTGARPAPMALARLRAAVVVVLLLIGLLQANRIVEASEAAIFGGSPVIREQSRYQRIVVTERGAQLELHLNGNLQFSSLDEHRYHEALVHPAMAATRRPERVLIGGGGDGLAAREVFAWKNVKEVTLVDLDQRMTELFREHPALVKLNRGALSDSRLSIVNADALVWLTNNPGSYDVVILDFPDPSNYSLGKLYSDRFYRLVREHLAPDGTLVVQSTSPLFARAAYWCIVRTLQSVGLTTLPYHVFVPSFGEWGYVLAKREAFALPTRLPEGASLRYLDQQTMPGLFAFSPDMQPVATRINRLNNQSLVAYYLRDWPRWN